MYIRYVYICISKWNKEMSIILCNRIEILDYIKRMDVIIIGLYQNRWLIIIFKSVLLLLLNHIQCPVI